MSVIIRCRRCGEEKLPGEFYPSNRNFCKECRNERARKYLAAMKERLRIMRMKAIEHPFDPDKRPGNLRMVDQRIAPMIASVLKQAFPQSYR